MSSNEPVRIPVARIMTGYPRLLSDAPSDLTVQEYHYLRRIIQFLEYSFDKLLSPDDYVVTVRLETFIQAPTNTRYWTATIWVHDGHNLMCELLGGVPRSAKLKEDALHNLCVQVHRLCNRYEEIYEKAEVVVGLAFGHPILVPILTVKLVPHGRLGLYRFFVGFYGVTAENAPPKYKFTERDDLADFVSAFGYLVGGVNSICD